MLETFGPFFFEVEQMLGLPRGQQGIMRLVERGAWEDFNGDRLVQSVGRGGMRPRPSSGWHERSFGRDLRGDSVGGNRMAVAGLV